MGHIAHILIRELAKALDGACYSKLSQREQHIANILLGLDALERNGNRLHAR